MPFHALVVMRYFDRLAFNFFAPCYVYVVTFHACWIGPENGERGCGRLCHKYVHFLDYAMIFTVVRHCSQLFNSSNKRFLLTVYVCF